MKNAKRVKLFLLLAGSLLASNVLSHALLADAPPEKGKVRGSCEGGGRCGISPGGVLLIGHWTERITPDTTTASGPLYPCKVHL